MPSDTQTNSRGVWLTRIALGLAMVLVIARASMTEMLRNPFDVRPSTAMAPRGLGAAGSVVLDFLLCLPAVLVLIRSAMERPYQISFTRVHAIGFALAAWIVISTFWAADRFAAAVDATHWAAATVLLWSVSQLVDSWTRLRLIGAVCLGTLLILTAHGAVYRFVDVPDQRQSFLEHEQEIYKENGWPADSFIAQQFKKKVMSGEVIGFSDSPNTYAMMLVLLGLISAGVAMQRINDRDEWGWPAAIIVALAPAMLMLWLTHCRAALATPIIGTAFLIAAAGKWGERGTLPAAWLTAMHRRAYWLAVAVVVCCVAGVIGFGISRGSLIHDSLTFRWRYWVGAMRLVEQHLLLGVGFANFGPNYLSVRLPIASEEIQDPHNFFVRILVETGLVGAAMLTAWLMRLWWEMTCPLMPQEPRTRPSPRPLATAFAIALGAMLVNTLASVDFSQGGSWIVLELMKRFLWLALLFIGIVIGQMRSVARPVLDDRPAPWVVWAIIASLAVFFLHNTIEFGLFESAPLGMFALLAGAALGIRGAKHQFGVTWVLTGGAFIVWLLMGLLWIKPMVYAEGQARAGDDDLQQNRPAVAAEEYARAYSGLPLRNAEYAMELATAQMYTSTDPAQVMDSLDRAIAADPLLIKGFLTRAQFRLHLNPIDVQKVKQDYQTAIDLNPNDVDVRTEFGNVLESLGFAHEAAQAYRAALVKNDGLSPDEPKRLTADQLKNLSRKILLLDKR